MRHTPIHEKVDWPPIQQRVIGARAFTTIPRDKIITNPHVCGDRFVLWCKSKHCRGLRSRDWGAGVRVGAHVPLSCVRPQWLGSRVDPTVAPPLAVAAAATVHQVEAPATREEDWRFVTRDAARDFGVHCLNSSDLACARGPIPTPQLFDAEEGVMRHHHEKVGATHQQIEIAHSLGYLRIAVVAAPANETKVRCRDNEWACRAAARCDQIPRISQIVHAEPQHVLARRGVVHYVRSKGHMGHAGSRGIEHNPQIDPVLEVG